MTHTLSLDDLIAWHRSQAKAAERNANELECQAAHARGMAEAHQTAIQELIDRIQQATASTQELPSE